MSIKKDKEVVSEIKRVLGLKPNCAVIDIFVEIGRLQEKTKPFNYVTATPVTYGTGTGTFPITGDEPNFTG